MKRALQDVAVMMGMVRLALALRAFRRSAAKTIIERWVGHFRKADPEFGDRLAQELARRRMSRRAGFEGINPIAAEKRRND